MTAEFWLIQYIEDIFRAETRNVGVMVCAGREACFSGLGVNEKGEVDLDVFQALAPTSANDAWVYGEWVQWFRALADDYACNDLFPSQLELLDQTNSPFVARRGGSCILPPGQSLQDAAKELHLELVRPPRRSPVSDFDQRLEEVLRASGLKKIKDLEENVEVEFPPQKGRPEETIRLSYLIDTKPRTLFKVVRLRTNRQAFFRQLNDATYSYRLVADIGFATSERCVVLTESVSASKAKYLGRIEELSHIVDITATGAARKIANILKGSPLGTGGN